eukprot:630306-Pyramimonas_sp.AAC.1
MCIRDRRELARPAPPAGTVAAAGLRCRCTHGRRRGPVRGFQADEATNCRRSARGARWTTGAARRP